jgi:ribosome-binding protein aMBF1 (putative translation factor)
MPTADFDVYLDEVANRPEERGLLDAARARVALGVRLAEHRNARGITQTELAARTGVPQSEISRIEGGRANPTVKTLAVLGAELGVELAWSPAASG